ncbi:hypothetical protein [Paramicrobacterium fandaimingii]|uniref:hypothetical protein n=1 Tax=Paramicrobacterium fandaimingii TaxID=2708079 RepID=UPI00141E4382|nr:hypothetical protein [Microbacterium fandaimingii]
MNTKNLAKRMLWIGVALIAVGLIGSVLVSRFFTVATPDPVAMTILNSAQSILSWTLLCGCGSLAVSFPIRALHGRALSIRHRRSVARLLQVIGVITIGIGLVSTIIVSALNQFLMMSNTGQDILLMTGPILFPLFATVIPTVGVLLLPLSVLQRIIERDASTHEQIFTGRAAD